eukprot:GEZU01024853.1.p1 GENE.GEZU01024853.1~~GEZU01024853.1.p1  ORF type:complete len:162 (+),score=2.13 GEZU01024853.1:272-757(+)
MLRGRFQTSVAASPSLISNTYVCFFFQSILHVTLPPHIHTQVPQLLEILRQYIYHNDTEMLSDASWGISYLSDATNDRVDLVVQSGVCRRMVELLLYHDDTVVAPALRTVGNILTGNYEQTQTIINVGGLQCLRHLLAHPKKSIRKETPLPMPRLAEQPTK